jgi:hypothetical protein
MGHDGTIDAILANELAYCSKAHATTDPNVGGHNAHGMEHEKDGNALCGAAIPNGEDVLTWIGAAVIFSGITYITYRERKLAKSLK